MNIEDIARLANVSKSTVSRVINNKSEGVGDDTRQRVTAIVREHSFSPAPRRHRTRTIGVIVPDLSNDFFVALVKELEYAAAAYNYSVIICHTESNLEKEEKAISTLLLMHVEGIVLTSAVNEAIDVHRKLSTLNIPYILLDRSVRNIDNSVSITVDNEYAVFTMTKHLIKSGSKRILFISGPVSVSTSIERLNGHTLALKHYNIPFRQEYIKYGDYSFQSGIDIIKLIYEEKLEIDALIAANDNMAIGAMKALKEYGYAIPGDVQVFGFDNTRSSQVVEPALSTVEQPIKEMGQKTVDIIMAQINKEPIRDNWIRLDSHVIYRESTK